MIFASNICTMRGIVAAVVVGTIIPALGLAGCGRKAGLDPPPLAAPAPPPLNAPAEAAPPPDR